MTVGERIRERRRELGMTQEELGKKLGYGKSAVCRVEKEGNNITTDRISRFAKALDCTPGFLMGWDVYPHQKQFNVFDIAGDKETADKVREEQFDYRFETEYKTTQKSLTKEEIIVIEGYRELSDDQKELMKRMVNYYERLANYDKDVHRP